MPTGSGRKATQKEMGGFRREVECQEFGYLVVGVGPGDVVDCHSKVSQEIGWGRAWGQQLLSHYSTFKNVRQDLGFQKENIQRR